MISLGKLRIRREIMDKGMESYTGEALQKACGLLIQAEISSLILGYVRDDREICHYNIWSYHTYWEANK